MCEGSGDYEVYVSADESHHDVSCPLCGGDGNYQVSVYEEIDTEEEIYVNATIEPYSENYVHYGNKISMACDRGHVRKTRVEAKAKNATLVFGEY